MLYLTGLGLSLKDITLAGLDSIKQGDHIFYEDHTSIIDWIHELEGVSGREFKRLERKDIEEGSTDLVRLASVSNVVLLVSGDPLAATTHQAIVEEAVKSGVGVRVLHAPSVMTVIGETGLSLYKFGRTVTIPSAGLLDSVKEFIEKNKSVGLHTLILLDIGMTCGEAVNRLVDARIIELDTQLIACMRLGREDSVIKWANASEILKLDWNKHPQCLVLPGSLSHFEHQIF